MAVELKPEACHVCKTFLVGFCCVNDNCSYAHACEEISATLVSWVRRPSVLRQIVEAVNAQNMV